MFMILSFLAQSQVEIEKDIEYSVVDGKSLKLDLYLPASGKEKCPAVICIHGGGWSKGDKKDVRIARSMAEHGIVAVCPNYRLSGEAKHPAQVNEAEGGPPGAELEHPLSVDAVLPELRRGSRDEIDRPAGGL